MKYEEYIELGLNGKDPLKIILKGSIEKSQDNKIGVVSIVFATTDRDLAKEKINYLISQSNNKSNYYMIYSVPLNLDLTTLEHYPSIAIKKDDLK